MSFARQEEMIKQFAAFDSNNLPHESNFLVNKAIGVLFGQLILF